MITLTARRLGRFGIIAAASVVTSFPVSAHAEPASTPSAELAVSWQSFIDEAATRFSVPASWIRAVIQIESKGNPKALSPKGAVGLMQLMPNTYAELRIRYGLGADPTDPHDNIVAGTAYLRDVRERFGTEGFIAAYNAGPQRYEDHLATGRPLPDETLAYVAKLAPLLSGGPVADDRSLTIDHVSWQQAPLFVEQRAGVSGVSRTAFTPLASFGRSDRTVADLSALVPPPGHLFANKREAHSK
ncbi:MAG TPA: lytic transglycosylase domain-containing protein [Rhizobiaceae bacterium]|nr:lytic transglycosylase domain-containing protein [Rhizobiaceae bacterium]